MSKDWVGRFVCIECKSDQVFDPYKDKWVQQGMTPPCKYCGGVVEFISSDDEKDREQFLQRSDRRRGLFNDEE